MNPLLAALPAATRAAGYAVVRAVEGGVTQRAAIASLRSLGIPFSPRNPWGRILAYASDAARYSSHLRSINKAHAPNVERLPFSLGEQRRKFSWTVRMDLVNEEGERYEQFLTVSTDNPRMAVRDILRAAEDVYRESSGDPDFDLTGAVLVGGTRRYDT